VDASTITHHAQATWSFRSVYRYTYTKGYQATHPASISPLLQDEARMTKSTRVPSENRNECHARILKGSRDAQLCKDFDAGAADAARSQYDAA
jgi:hypothetical protein